MMRDILIKTDDSVFSYRVAGICVQNGKVLLQKPLNDDGYAFVGGHVAFGETNAQTLCREFKEEMGAEISVGELKWVAEIFFPWGGKACHQICLYYIVRIESLHTPKEGMFMAQEETDGHKSNVAFHWVSLDKMDEIELYPTNVVKLLSNLEDGVQHFVHREE